MDREFAAKRFAEIADKLETLDLDGRKRAELRADEGGLTGEDRRFFVENFANGWVVGGVNTAVREIRSAVVHYFTPPKRKR